MRSARSFPENTCRRRTCPVAATESQVRTASVGKLTRPHQCEMASGLLHRILMRTLAQDLRFALRMSLKSPGFTLVAVLTLAVGIAASTTVFSWIDTVLVRPIPGVANGHERGR